MLLQKPWYESIPELFEACHNASIFDDGKAIADAVPNANIDDIKNNYHNLKAAKYFDLKDFFTTFFTLPEQNSYTPSDRLKLEDHLKVLWQELKRFPDKYTPYSSLIPLPNAYVVPGGRFKEVYYWDSYFTMLGLKVHGEYELIRDMVKNFSYLIDQFGYIPNGNRTYYLGRSQPPFFSHMVQLLRSIDGPEILNSYRNSLEKEYQYWMNPENKKLVKLDGDLILNRYWDVNQTPRPEMMSEDLHLSEGSEEKSHFYQNIRAACESGWDFSSRWFYEDKDIQTIITTAIIPVDLNCLLYHLEKTLAEAYHDDPLKHDIYTKAAESRIIAINQFLWDNANGRFSDYNFILKTPTNSITAAMTFPLFVGIATDEQAEKVSDGVKEHLLRPGGIATTSVYSGQQWDAPNGWAPLQWTAFVGFKNYHINDLAEEIKARWVALNEKVYNATGKMMEKYNVEDLSLEAGGGEYPVQDGFGWSNGVYLAMKYFV